MLESISDIPTGMVDMNPYLEEKNIILYQELETGGDTSGHQLALEVHKQIEEPLRSECGIWSLL